MLAKATDSDRSSNVFCRVHLRIIPQQVHMDLVHNMYSNITRLKLPPHPPEVNELKITDEISRIITVLTHRGRDKMGVIIPTTFYNIFVNENLRT